MTHVERRLINDGLLPTMPLRDIVAICWSCTQTQTMSTELADAIARECEARILEKEQGISVTHGGITSRSLSTVFEALGSCGYSNNAFYSLCVRHFGDEFLEDLRPLELSRIVLGLAQGGCRPEQFMHRALWRWWLFPSALLKYAPTVTIANVMCALVEMELDPGDKWMERVHQEMMIDRNPDAKAEDLARYCWALAVMKYDDDYDSAFDVLYSRTSDWGGLLHCMPPVMLPLLVETFSLMKMRDRHVDFVCEAVGSAILTIDQLEGHEKIRLASAVVSLRESVGERLLSDLMLAIEDLAPTSVGSGPKDLAPLVGYQMLYSWLMVDLGSGPNKCRIWPQGPGPKDLAPLVGYQMPYSLLMVDLGSGPN
eukprot:gene19897-26600_t